MDKHEAAQVLREIGIILQLIDSQPLKGIAYLKAANSIEHANNFNELLASNRLDTLPGVGKTISAHIKTLIEMGRLPYFELLKSRIPPTLPKLAMIPGLSINKIKILHEQFKIASIDDLKEALAAKRLSGIKGFGPSFLKKLEERVDSLVLEGPLLLYPQAKSVSNAMKKSLMSYSELVVEAGPIRRLNELIGSLYFLAMSELPAECLQSFTKHYFVEKILMEGPSSATVLLKQGIQAVLEIVPAGDLAWQLFLQTGNEKHIAELKRKLSPSSKDSCSSEEAIYTSAGLHFIPPELREGYGEIEAAKKDDFSYLVKQGDLRGVFHCHTVDSDGANTIEEMAQAAIKMGWSYIGISDHSPSSYQANGLSEERLLNQMELIRSLNKHLPRGFHVFSGIECDILKEGKLDISDELLKELDFVIISIHSLFKQEQEVMTSRLIKAIEHPYTTMVGHLTGRLLRLRKPYNLDVPKVIDACIANGKIIELNCHPSRMDMDWREWAKARGRGLKCSINPDAHSIRELSNCDYGINMARKGWLRREDVINTLSLKEMKAFLKAR